MACGEFELIRQFFAKKHIDRADVKLGIGDDCALLAVEPGQLIAVSTDTLVSGVHFLPNISAADLAYKALAVNLSDLAAMGATPAWVSLALTLPEINETWLTEFSTSLFAALDYYQVQLIGGDTTKGPLSLTLTAQGLVPDGKALTRRGAKVGDWIYVTGTLGDSAAGLALLQQRLQIADEKTVSFLVNRHLRPQPRLEVSLSLRDVASAAIDLSDGLIADLGHILKASHCGANIFLDKLPLSSPMKQHIPPEMAMNWAVAGGEDYELCFTVSEMYRGVLETQLAHTNVNVECIGQITSQANQIAFFQNGQPVTLELSGYDHFK